MDIQRYILGLLPYKLYYSVIRLLLFFLCLITVWNVESLFVCFCLSLAHRKGNLFSVRAKQINQQVNTGSLNGSFLKLSQNACRFFAMLSVVLIPWV